MATSETQLQTWTNAGATSKIQATHAQIRTVIENNAKLKGVCEVFL